ncbi:hypothetical protein PMAYCL1PPCAC_24203, partial [Pristionchus mayeri]
RLRWIWRVSIVSSSVSSSPPWECGYRRGNAPSTSSSPFSSSSPESSTLSGSPSFVPFLSIDRRESRMKQM